MAASVGYLRAVRDATSRPRIFLVSGIWLKLIADKAFGTIDVRALKQLIQTLQCFQLELGCLV